MPDTSPLPAAVPTPYTFRRVHKSALGVAFGAMFGVALFVLTAVHVALSVDGLPLYLLQQYFRGYEVSWFGAFVGLAWGFAVGFVGGWLLGFVHNFTVAIWMLFIVARQDMRQTANFLDHI